MIKIEGVTRRYGSRVAVDNVSFSVARGEIVGFLGPNGAGKSTTMRMITGYLMPDEGSIRVAGHDMLRDPLAGRARIGYLPEHAPLYRDMTTREYLSYVAQLRAIDDSHVSEHVDRVIDLCQIAEYADTIIEKLSKGFRQRVGLAQAVIHEPDVLILDEPTVGIDPIQVAQTRDLIREIGRDRTILLSTHILPEVSMICDRVIIIHRGRIVANDDIEQLSALVHGGHRIRLRIDAAPDAVTAALLSVPGIEHVDYADGRHTISFESGARPHREIVQAIARNEWELLSMIPEQLSLEEIFLNLTTSEETSR